ncbi:MAG: YopX family protein [Clostridium sp.]|nr:YopX family protein [Clostridium sp.]
MREILFRGKHVSSGKWIISPSIRQEADGSVYLLVKRTWYCVDPKTVGQYTGLTDRMGTKIFEGDILEFSEDYDDKFGYPATSYGKCIVIYDESLLAWRIRGLDYEGSDDLCQYADSEIIGNIHDNPELLEVTE